MPFIAKVRDTTTEEKDQCLSFGNETLPEFKERMIEKLNVKDITNYDFAPL